MIFSPLLLQDSLKGVTAKLVVLEAVVGYCIQKIGKRLHLLTFYYIQLKSWNFFQILGKDQRTICKKKFSINVNSIINLSLPFSAMISLLVFQILGTDQKVICNFYFLSTLCLKFKFQFKT